MALFDSEYSEPKQPKKPTLRVYLKTATKQQLTQTFHVEIIWKPNQFPNYTLQTHAFVLRVPEDTVFYQELSDSIAEFEANKIGAIGIKVTDPEVPLIKFVPMDKKKGKWESLGSNGLKFSM